MLSLRESEPGLPWAVLSGAGEGEGVSIDPNGNTTQKVQGVDTWTYEWNAEDRIIGVEKNGVPLGAYAYDPRGRRVERSAEGVTTKYTYDSEHIVREARGQAALRYVHGPGVDEALSLGDEGSLLQTMHADGLGSIVTHAGPAGAVALERRYDAWGEATMAQGVSGAAFTGREWDPESGLYHYRARQYDAGVGRFLSRDAIGHVRSYDYVGSNPVNYVDPSGNVRFKIPITERWGFPGTGGLTGVRGQVLVDFECTRYCEDQWRARFTVTANIVTRVDPACPWWSRAHEQAHAAVLRADIVTLANTHLSPVEAEAFVSPGACDSAARAARDRLRKAGSSFDSSASGAHDHAEIDNYWIPCIG